MLVRTVLIFRKLTIWRGNWRLWKKNNWELKMATTETLVLKFIGLLCQNWWKLWSTYVGIVCDPGILCQMEGGQCCHPCAASTFYLQKFNVQVKPHWLLCYLLLEFLWTCFLIFPAQPLPWQLVSSPAKFKRKVLSSTLYCAPIHYAVQNGSNFWFCG